ncbi:MAG TPA: hypothetical protein VK090_06545 [Paracoccaceae bacterium]|nr:hypothetical protein [Paracoccaceae bacterium]
MRAEEQTAKPKTPTFIIAERPDGKLAARPLADGERGPETLERIRDKFARVWLAHAFMAATGTTQQEAAE